MQRKFGALSSSVNPQQLSATVTGGIVALSSLIIVVAHFVGIPLVSSQIADFAQQAGISVGFLVMVFGAVRKGIVLIQQKFFPAA